MTVFSHMDFAFSVVTMRPIQLSDALSIPRKMESLLLSGHHSGAWYGAWTYVIQQFRIKVFNNNRLRKRFERFATAGRKIGAGHHSECKPRGPRLPVPRRALRCR